MKKLTIRKRGPGSYDVGPIGIGPHVNVQARDKRQALRLAKQQLTHGQLDVIRVTKWNNR